MLYNLTLPQQQIFDAVQFAGGAVSTITGYCLFKNPVERRKLQECISRLYRINDSLRIRIQIDEAGQPRQYFRDYNPRETEALTFKTTNEFEAFASEYAARPLDLTGELCQIRIIEIAGTSGILVKIHHIISDAWSLSILIKQLLCLLDGGAPVSGSYEDYISKDKEYCEGPRYQADGKYFDEIISSKDLAPVRSTAAGSFDAAQKRLGIPEELSCRIQAFCDANDISRNIFWLTCFAAFMEKRSADCKAFTLAVPVLNRITAKELSTVGMFTNNILLPLALDYTRSLRYNMEHCTEPAFMTAVRHQRFNISCLSRRSSGSVAAIYDTVFSYQTGALESEAAIVRQVFSGKQTEPLQLHVDESASCIYYEYRCDCHSEGSISRMHEKVLEIAGMAVDSYESPVSAISLLTKEDAAFLKSINRTQCPLPEERNCYELFMNSLRQSPDSICLSTKERSYTYNQFNSMVINLDCEIRKALPGTGNVIAVCCDRGIEMYTSIYAIMRSGNTFLPVATDNPVDYTKLLLGRSGAALLLTTGNQADLDCGVPVINATAVLESRGTSPSGEAPEPRYCDAAYILFTSGSTGVPKGVEIGNRALVNRIVWMQKHFALDSGSVILQKTPYTFDVSVWEIFLWGLSGASLAVPGPGEHFIPSALVENIERHRVTHLHFVPSVFEAFLEHLEAHPAEAERLASLKAVIFSGEALTAGLINRFHAICSCDISMHNLYGPTECTIDVTYYDCASLEADPVPIGKPIDNTYIYVLDENRNPVIPGAEGELAIGGAGVGSGYVGDRAATDAKFIKNPFGEGRLYLTGDTVVLRADGQLVYIGRNDSQVKINGKRIELSAIEETIKEIPGVTTAAVLADKSGSRVLLRAFWSGSESDPEKVKAFCENKLPLYMLPNTWNHIPSIPLTKHGKADVKKLLSIPLQSSAPHASEAPENDTETAICEAYNAALHIKSAGRNNSFFDLGGTSLGAAKLLSTDLFSSISLFDFMKDSRPCSLARLLLQKQAPESSSLHRLSGDDNCGEALVLFPFAGGNMLAYSRLISEIRSAHPDASVFGTDFPQTQEEIKAIADGVYALSKNHAVRFYSHCAGAAAAIAVIEELESRSIYCVKDYTAGALIPPVPRSGRCFNIWKMLPDRVILRFLKKSGLELSGDESLDFISRFRKDTEWYFSFFSSGPKPKLKCPVKVILSRKDPLTKCPEKAAVKWSRHFESVTDVRLTDFPSHYFQNTNPKALADYIYFFSVDA